MSLWSCTFKSAVLTASESTSGTRVRLVTPELSVWAGLLWTGLQNCRSHSYEVRRFCWYRSNTETPTVCVCVCVKYVKQRFLSRWRRSAGLQENREDTGYSEGMFLGVPGTRSTVVRPNTFTPVCLTFLVSTSVTWSSSTCPPGWNVNILHPPGPTVQNQVGVVWVVDCRRRVSGPPHHVCVCLLIYTQLYGSNTPVVDCNICSVLHILV